MTHKWQCAKVLSSLLATARTSFLPWSSTSRREGKYRGLVSRAWAPSDVCTMYEMALQGGEGGVACAARGGPAGG